MSVTVKEKPKTPKFKIGDSVLVKNGSRGIIVKILSPTLYMIDFPNCSPCEFTEDNLTIDNGIVDDIMKIFEKLHLTPISRLDRHYAQGWIDCAFVDDNMLPEQRDELYKKMGIE